MDNGREGILSIMALSWSHCTISGENLQKVRRASFQMARGNMAQITSRIPHSFLLLLLPSLFLYPLQLKEFNLDRFASHYQEQIWSFPSLTSFFSSPPYLHLPTTSLFFFSFSSYRPPTLSGQSSDLETFGSVRNRPESNRSYLIPQSLLS